LKGTFDDQCVSVSGTSRAANISNGMYRSPHPYPHHLHLGNTIAPHQIPDDPLVVCTIQGKIDPVSNAQQPGGVFQARGPREIAHVVHLELHSSPFHSSRSTEFTRKPLMEVRQLLSHQPLAADLPCTAIWERLALHGKSIIAPWRPLLPDSD
jgi:hypothetical protein